MHAMSQITVRLTCTRTHTHTEAQHEERADNREFELLPRGTWRASLDAESYVLHFCARASGSLTWNVILRSTCRKRVPRCLISYNSQHRKQKKQKIMHARIQGTGSPGVPQPRASGNVLPVTCFRPRVSGHVFPAACSGVRWDGRGRVRFLLQCACNKLCMRDSQDPF